VPGGRVHEEVIGELGSGRQVEIDIQDALELRRKTRKSSNPVPLQGHCENAIT
jgi:hypothetical protein